MRVLGMRNKESLKRSPADVALAGLAVLGVMGMGSLPLATAEQQRPPVTPPPAVSAAPPPATPAGTPVPGAPGAKAPLPPAGFTYEAGGRRDPFISLANQGSDPRSEGRTRYQGLAGVGVGEVSVKGIVLYERQLVAMVQAPDNRTYLVRPNDRLLDGSVRAVTSEAVVFVQQVNDPLSLVKQREIRKALRAPEETK
jgi:Tfp pilus assembly protein PilP